MIGNFIFAWTLLASLFIILVINFSSRRIHKRIDNTVNFEGFNTNPDQRFKLEPISVEYSPLLFSFDVESDIHLNKRDGEIQIIIDYILPFEPERAVFLIGQQIISFKDKFGQDNYLPYKLPSSINFREHLYYVIKIIEFHNRQRGRVIAMRITAEPYINRLFTEMSNK